ncbi:MAG: chemotaxis protein CheW [Betaproteobacteria bacterium]
MNSEMVVPAAARQSLAAVGKSAQGVSDAGSLYLAFRLGDEVYAIDILRIREILEYTVPTSVPMMPPSVRGVINLRGAVVPVIDLSVRFGREATGVGKRTCIVIVEVEHAGADHILGLLVDGVNAVMEIGADSIEPAPAFGTRVNTEFISGMARVNGRFVILLDIARVLSIEEMAAIKSVARGDEQ